MSEMFARRAVPMLPGVHTGQDIIDTLVRV